MDFYSLKSVSDLPPVFRSTFSFRYFNSLQSECFSACFQSDFHMVISAPTGSGKTVLFELCILRILSRFITAETFNHIQGTNKTIYIAPSKALVQEKLRIWSQKLGSLGITCLELTSDNEACGIKNVREADIILTTPEKFDAVTRYGAKDGGLSFVSDIALVLIDEVHILNDPRGAALEAIISRLKMLARKPEIISTSLANVRFMAVSATIPNIEDLAEWLTVQPQGIRKFGEEMRPVKLTTKVFGYTPAKNDFLFEKRLQNYIFDILMQFSRGKSALIFCSTRKGAQEAAQCLCQIAMSYGHSNPFIKNAEQLERLQKASLSCDDKHMQSYILYGVGYHNGGLSLKDRNLIEGLFLIGDIQILCTTNTLAHGINLPAHTVVIKSTQYFNKDKGAYMEYDRSMILQMSGRAGRPPFDETGIVIVMTRRDTVHLYENLLNGCEMVESQLLSSVTEHLMAEIVQLTIPDITHAIEWMKCSYLYVRTKKNPENYGLKKETQKERIENHMHDICVQKVNELTQHEMIWRDDDGFVLKPLEPGNLMTKYYLKFDTMKHIMRSPVNCSLEDSLHIICRAYEFSWIQLRRNEKRLLNDVNADKNNRLRFHVIGENRKKKRRIQTTEEKIFVLLNDCLTGDPLIHDLSLTQDMNSVCSNGCRISKCMKDYFIYRNNYKGFLNSSMLAKSLNHRLWDDSPYLLRQLPGIGMVTAKALHSMGIFSFETLEIADPRRIEMVTGRRYPYGNRIKESLQSLPPKIEMKMEETENGRSGICKISITLIRVFDKPQSLRHHYADLVAGVEEDNKIVFHEKIRLDEFSSPYSTTFLLNRKGKTTLNFNLIFEDYIGIDLHQTLVLLKGMGSGPAHGSAHGPAHLGRVKPALLLPPPEDVDVMEVEEVHLVPKVVGDSMPSFNLLDDEPEEIVKPDLKGREEEEEEDCVLITAETVFQHIREKAKTFPAAVSSSIEFPKLTRKRVFRDLTQPHSPSQVAAGAISENVTINTAPENPGIYNVISSTPISVPVPAIDKKGEEGESEEDCVILSEETVFQHILHKAKSFPLFPAPNTDPDSSVLSRKRMYAGRSPALAGAELEIVPQHPSLNNPSYFSSENHIAVGPTPVTVDTKVVGREQVMIFGNLNKLMMGFPSFDEPRVGGDLAARYSAGVSDLMMMMPPLGDSGLALAHTQKSLKSLFSFL